MFMLIYAISKVAYSTHSQILYLLFISRVQWKSLPQVTIKTKYIKNTHYNLALYLEPPAKLPAKQTYCVVSSISSIDQEVSSINWKRHRCPLWHPRQSFLRTVGTELRDSATQVLRREPSKVWISFISEVLDCFRSKDMTIRYYC